MSDFSNSFLEKLTNQRFSYRQYSKVQFAGQGIVLEQNKEPALSGGIRPFFTRAMENVPIEDASPEDDIITISRKAGIVDENTGRPLYLLLERAKNAGCRIVVADALDDEPYISSQLAPALEMTDLLVRGAQLACEAIAADEVRVEIYKELGETRVEIGETLGGLPVDRVGAGYPADNSLILSTIAPEKEETEQSVLSPLVFLFENAADLTAGARRLYQQYAHRIYQSALYQNGEEYLLVLRPLDRCSMESSLLLSEYGTPVAEGELSAAVIDEHCTSLYTSEALEHLSNEGV